MNLFVKSIAIVGLSFFLGCGGGGGGGGDDGGIPRTCITYCSSACSKGVNCGFFPGSERPDCVNACESTIESEGTATSSSCQELDNRVAGMTCEQYADFLGLSGTLEKSIERDDSIGVGISLAANAH